MAAPLPARITTETVRLVILFFICGLPPIQALVYTFEPADILNIVSSSCLVALPKSVNDTEALNLLSTLSDRSYKEEPLVVVGRLDTSNFLWPNGNVFATDDETDSFTSTFNSDPVFLLFKRVVKDRKCLLIPKNNIVLPKVLTYNLRLKMDYEIENIVKFVNYNCETFRMKDGRLNNKGLHRNYILENVYWVPTIKNRDSMPRLNNNKNSLNINMATCDSPAKYFIQNYGSNNKSKKSCTKKSTEATVTASNNNTQMKMQQCDRISLPSLQDFLHNYVFKSKPVIIEGATYLWPALKKWTNQYLRERYGDQVVHIKITPSGEYEGVEHAHLWKNSFNIKIPQEVLAKLPYPNLLVVRPATMELKFSEFLDLVEDVATKKRTNMSAYLEYSSIKDYFPDLRQDFEEMSFFENVLELRHINMWLSDGNTLGKLHFDPFDNFMCQISGSKEFTLYDPHDNERLYEAHIQEAMLSYNSTTNSFSRKRLMDSTSMVMSPVDIKNPDLQRFPRFAEAVPMSCQIQHGDVLFMPAFWWHEVKSSPNITERRNLAINFWYEPFLQKEFPCAECGLDVNPRYFNLL